MTGPDERLHGSDSVPGAAPQPPHRAETRVCVCDYGNGGIYVNVIVLLASTTVIMVTTHTP